MADVIFMISRHQLRVEDMQRIKSEIKDSIATVIKEKLSKGEDAVILVSGQSFDIRIAHDPILLAVQNRDVE